MINQYGIILNRCCGFCLIDYSKCQALNWLIRGMTQVMQKYLHLKIKNQMHQHFASISFFILFILFYLNNELKLDSRKH